MFGTTFREKHRMVEFTDQNGEKRNACRCQVKERHRGKRGKVYFPVFECPEMTRRYGFGSESGYRKA